MDIGLRFSNFGLEMVKNCRAEKSNFFGLHYSLLMHLGQDQQQHPTVNRGGVSKGGSVAVAVGVSDI